MALLVKKRLVRKKLLTKLKTTKIKLAEPVEPEIPVLPEPELDLRAINAGLVLNIERVSARSCSDPLLTAAGVIRNLCTVATAAGCCAFGSCMLNTLSPLLGFVPATTFGELLYNKWSIVWNSIILPSADTVAGQLLREGKYTVGFSTNTGADLLLQGSVLNSGYVFAYASHQDIRYKEYLEAIGAISIDIGHNTRYAFNSGHHITIYILSREASAKKFFEIHKEFFTKKYSALTSQTA